MLELKISLSAKGKIAVVTLWLPKHLDIKAVVLDVDYCERMRVKLRRLAEEVETLGFVSIFSF